MISDIRYVTLAVDDLEVATTFFLKGIGFDQIDRGEIRGDGYAAIWGMPPELVGRVRLVGRRGVPSGVVRLVEFSAHGPAFRSDPANQAPGLAAIVIRAREIDSLWRRSSILDALPLAEPDPATEPLLARMALPDASAVIDIMQTAHDGLGPPLETTGAVQSVVLRCRDVARSRTFYASLGFVAAGRPALQADAIELSMPGLPAEGGLTLLTAHGAAAEPRIPGRGWLSMSLETDDLDATAAVLSAIGAVTLSLPWEVDVPQIGLARAQSFGGPDGERIEIIEAL